MWTELVGGAACGAAGLICYGVRGRSSSLLGPSVYRGPAGRRAIALTFDDGPSESTPELLELLDRHGARATFFQCGVNVCRLPEVASEVARRGHEIGNHSHSHRMFCFRSPQFIYDDLARAQEHIIQATGFVPRLFRAPYGVRWFGLRGVQRRLGLLGVMWTVLARDWKLPSDRIVARLLSGAANGAILCLHDGRTVELNPAIGPTVDAVRRLLPELQARGFTFETVSELLCPKN